MGEEKEFKKMYDDLKGLKPLRKGAFLGAEEEKFYVAKTEEEVYELSALAYYVWLLCDGEHSIEEIADRISKEVQLEKEEIIEALMLALDGLSNVCLVEFAYT